VAIEVLQDEELDGVIVVADASHLSRSLFLISQVMEKKQPIVVAVNMVDIAESNGIHVDTDALSRELGCAAVPVVARAGEGVAGLRDMIDRKILRRPAADTMLMGVSACGTCGGCRFQSRYKWTDAVTENCVRRTDEPVSSFTEKLDGVLTHPVIGVVAFTAVMILLFFLIFQIASVPMKLIDSLFTGFGAWVAGMLPDGDFESLLVKGVIGGVGGMLVFLPQICILFFCLALLEDTGYLARAAFVMDRIMRHVGLPGKAFVPLLSSHACAIPAIMATRVIDDRRDRLVTIMVAPLISCSARIPVYSMLAALLFGDDALMAALIFTGAYTLGTVAAVAAAFVFKKTILKGETLPLVLELPSYKKPSLRTAVLTVLDRAMVFVKNAGTVILGISILLWALSTYPKSAPPEDVVKMRQVDQTEADRLESRYALAHSAAGRLGRLIEPVIRPLGFDWQIGIGIISSFAAREVVVSTLAIVYGVGEDVAEKDPRSLYDSLRRATRNDGSRVFTTATCASLLVFYVLAMQCLSTQAVTRRETNSWKWPIIQLVYMTVLAYGASYLIYQLLRAMGVD
jgi:ferrous iron transport protein B